MPEIVMPIPSCPLGYTREDLEKNWGAKEGRPHSLWRQLRGQPGQTCTGQEYNEELEGYVPTSCADNPHGVVVFANDVREWALWLPVSDW